MLELNQTRAADFDLIARCAVPLASLLSSKPRLVSGHNELHFHDNDSIADSQ